MIDFSKFVKYSKAGPRYTSYPTAPEFNEGFTEQIYITELKSQSSAKPLSIYVHLPFCRSACYFCGCNVIFTSKDDKRTRYIEYLKKELDLLSKYIDTTRSVTQLHFGGGTPTYFTPDELDEIIKYIKKSFPNFSNDAELSCEVDPRFFSREHMVVLKDGGINRLSFGVQDFDERVQKVIHRVQSFDLTKNVVDIAREFKVDSINIDLIYGLPFQTKESFHRTLELVKSLNPDRLAIFNYAHVPWMKKTMRKFDETTLPKPDEKLKILEDVIDYFTTNSYKMVGMDHFAKEDDELFLAIEKGELNRNFQGYTTKGGADLIGVGVTSIGEGEMFYAQNYRDLASYENALDNGRLPIFRGYKLSKDDKIRQSLIMEMMSNFKLNIKKLEERFDIDFFEYFKDDIPLLDEFIKEELVKINKESIDVSDTGSMLIRNIVMPFDAHLKKIPQERRKFSKTI
jgi:oxygen-independent coproporphyrinogen-3 oxidase